MIATLAQLWRYPIKSHGREQIARTDLLAGKSMPWDRHWAVLHDNAPHDGNGWARCRNFMIGARTPGLAGLWASLDIARNAVHLRHAALGEFRIDPDAEQEAAAFFAWLAPLLPEDNVQPSRIIRAGGRGMTDTDYASISIMNLASHRAVADRLGKPLEIERWRGNIWIDGLSAFEEFEWVGKRVRIGSALLDIREPVQRCLHTAANTVSGARDIDTLGLLNGGWGHQDFGVYAQVIEPGAIAVGDRVVPA